MRPTRSTFRLFVEMLAIVLIAELAVMWVMGLTGLAGISALGAAMIDGAALVLLAGPLLLWRVGGAAPQPGLPPDPLASPRRRRALTAGATALTLLAGLVTAAVVGLQMRHQHLVRVASEFHRVTDLIEAQAATRLRLLTAEPQACVGVFRASRAVERAEFREFALASTAAVGAPGAGTIGYAARVAPGGLDAFVEAQRADGAPGFPRPEAPEGADWCYVSTFLEPEAPGLFAPGADLARDPAIRAAADRAMLSGQPVISSPVGVEAGAGAGTGAGTGTGTGSLLVYLVPVYANGSDPGTPAAREASLTGWVFMPVAPGEFFAGLAGSASEWVDAEFYEGRLLDPDALVFDACGAAGAAGAAGSAGAGAAPGHPGGGRERSFTTTRAMQFAGREWTLWMGSTPAFDRAQASTQPLVVFACGVQLSILAAVVIWGFGDARARALGLAAQMTHDLRAREREAREALARLDAYRQAIDQLAITAITDASGTIIDANARFAEISGYSREELIGRTHRIVNSGVHPKRFWVDCWKTIAAGRVWRGEICNRAKDGTLYWVDSSIGPVRDADGRISGFLALRVDISEQKRHEEALLHAAYSDEMTGMANRLMLAERLAEAVAERHGAGGSFALLAMDIDRFAFINDTLGHGVGDEILREAADRIRSTVSQSGLDALAARIGSDGFAVLVRGAGEAESAALGERLLATFAEPFHPGGRELFLTTSIGSATDDGATPNAEEILRSADIALYEAKLAGRGRMVRFEARMGDRIHQRMSIEHDLRAALGTDQLFLVYQPIVSLETQRVEGFETLVRWRHPERGLIRPDEFIPIAEQTGLIIPLGHWILTEACRQIARWRAALGPRAPRHVSVNLSRSQLVQHDLPETIREVLRQTGVPPSALYLEITETAVMQDIASGTRMLYAIRDIGVKQSLDDFGTGHSSLASLSDFPVEIVKIDRSFVANIERGRRFVALVHTAVELAANLGMAVVAEGIEDKDQLATLLSMGCEFGQGMYFSGPLTAAEVPGYLAEWARTRRDAA
ncbi:MAG: EAL domain-containing protein [Phycisphaerales bacterium]|nr:EAL domain-containing protein [Phycisphaerales bacterium]